MKKPLHIDQLIAQPEKAFEFLNIRYIQEDQLSISRKKNGDLFIYTLKDKPLNKKNVLKRIEKLVIPPAWQKVKISELDNGHLQAVGRDVKNRKQYRYHEVWSKIRNQTKFFKMSSFAKQLPKIRKKADEDMNQKGWPKSKVLGLIINLMEETHIRIGNEQYAKRNKTYGLSTLRTRHVHTFKDKMKFEFVGKKGKKHEVTLRNKKLMRLVNKCEEIPGWELFQYYDDQGNKHRIDSSDINEYIQDICGEIHTAKDFRTWAGTMVFFETLMDIGIEPDEQKAHKNVLKAFDAAAEALGNTRNVCRKYYVHPLLEERYKSGKLEEAFFKVHKMKKGKVNFSPSEIVVLDLIEQYTPEFLKNAS